MNDLTVTEYKGLPVTDSRDVAKMVGKRHGHLLRDIESYIAILRDANAPKVGLVKSNESKLGSVKNAAPKVGASGTAGDFSLSGTEPNFGPSNFFIKSTYTDSKGEKRPCYLITRKGCDMIANKMTGKKGVLFTAAYVTRFYEMEDALRSRQAARMDFPQFTDAVKRIHENPAPYHFTNEINLINRLVLGMDAKKYKEANGIPLSEKSIRPYLPPEQIRLVDALQKADIGLMISERDYSKRKMLLEWYLNSLRLRQISA